MATGTGIGTRGLAFILSTLSLVSAVVRAQTRPFVVYFQDGPSERKSPSHFLRFRDSAEAARHLQLQAQRLWSSGHFFIRYDTLKHSIDTLRLRLIVGPRTAPPIVVLRGEQKACATDWHHLFTRCIIPLLEKKENSGYPFARIEIDSIGYTANRTVLHGLLDGGPLILMDTLELVGNARLARQFLEAYLDLRPGSRYREATLRRTRQLLERLPFATLAQPPRVAFLDSLARLQLHLQRKPSSSVYGFLGLAPASPFNPRLLLMGELRLALYHALGYGESVDLEWRRLHVQTQSLRFALAWPYLLHTPLGAEGQFDFYRKDSSFQNVQLAVGLRYLLPGQNFVRIGYQRFISRLIDRKSLAGLTTLPSAHDALMDLFQVGCFWDGLDSRLNPTRGVLVQAETSLGRRTMPRLGELPDSLYEEVPFRQPFWSGQIRTDAFAPAGKLFVVRTGFMGGMAISGRLFQNQLFRLGGLRNLRGFNEESLFAATYACAVLEPRLRLEGNSFACAFVNGGYILQRRPEAFMPDWPVGFGLGGALDTRAGQVELYYAYGIQKNAPLRWREAKIHLGYRALF